MELNKEEKLTHSQKYRAYKTQWDRGGAFCPYCQNKNYRKNGISRHLHVQTRKHILNELLYRLKNDGVIV